MLADFFDISFVLLCIQRFASCRQIDDNPMLGQKFLGADLDDQENS